MKIVELLLKSHTQGSLKDCVDGMGKTPLHHASGCGHYRVVEVLLHAKADPDIRFVLNSIKVTLIMRYYKSISIAIC